MVNANSSLPTSTGNAVFFTDDQLHTEKLAHQLLVDPRTQIWLREVKEEWYSRWKGDDALRARFESAFLEAAFSGLMHAAARDSLYPRLYALGRMEHVNDGLTIPGTRSAHPNPDYIYRFVTIDGASRYVLRGRMPVNRPSAAEYALLTAKQAYQHNLSMADIQVNQDGTFELTFDSEPAGDRPNHFRTNDESVQILLRDVIGDGHRQDLIELAVERLGPPPVRPPLSYQKLCEDAEAYVRRHITDCDFTTKNFAMKGPANVFEPPMVHSDERYSAAQAYSAGWFHLDPDQAIVVTLSQAGAAYAVAPLTDLWGWPGDVLDHAGAIGTDIAVANADGSYTFVIAAEDPLQGNWLDPDGLHSGVIFFRWIGLPRGGVHPALDVKLVPASDIPLHVVDGTPAVSKAERAAWMARRKTGLLRISG